MKRIWIPSGALLLLAMVLVPWQAQAFEFNTGNTDLEIRWDNTLKYSMAYRLKDQSETLIADVNYDDGDRNFDKGISSIRFDWLSELEANLPHGGIRVSSALWYDAIYNKGNDNDSPFTNNSTSVPHDRFTDATKKIHGKDIEILDAFVYANVELGEMILDVRAGRHTQIYGETLFFGSNGIADAQGPNDLVKLLTVPSSLFKETLRPVEQVSANLMITPNLSLGAYYQFRWHETRIPAAGSYLSSADFVGEGAESWILGPGVAMSRTNDLEPDDSGQGGVQLRYTLESLGLDLGLYAARYHAKTPTAPYIDPVVTMQYRWVYAQDIDTYGISATGTIGLLNLAAEVSYRLDAPLNSDPQVDVGLTAGNDENDRLYAVGDTVHANLSGVYMMRSSNFFCEGGTLLAEIAYNRVQDINDNPSALAQNTTKDAWAFRMIFEPAYFQILTGLDLTVPIGVGWNFSGRSSAIGNWNGGSSEAGDLSIGLSFVYRSVWKAGLSYVKYWGDEETFTVPHNSPTPHLSFNQTLADRDSISFNISRAF